MAVDYPTRSSTVVVANAALLVITGVFIIVRLWVRVFLLHNVGLDDVLIWASSVFAFTLSISEILSTLPTTHPLFDIFSPFIHS